MLQELLPQRGSAGAVDLQILTVLAENPRFHLLWAEEGGASGKVSMTKPRGVHRHATPTCYPVFTTVGCLLRIEVLYTCLPQA